MCIAEVQTYREGIGCGVFYLPEGGEYLLFSRDLFTDVMRRTAALTRWVLRCAESVVFKTECSLRKRNQK